MATDERDEIEAAPPNDPPIETPDAGGLSEDWLAVCVGGLLLAATLAVVALFGRATVDGVATVRNPLQPLLAKPAKWTANPLDAFTTPTKTGEPAAVGVVGAAVLIAAVFAAATSLRGRSAGAFLKAFPAVALLAVAAYVLAGQALVKSYNLEYALWALALGLLVSNTVGTPQWLRPAVLTEFYIKTGLVLLGAEVLMSRLLALGLPGVCVAWVVTPVVLIGTYAFGQKVLKIPSRSLNMVISADMSVCGVSAAIATAAACRAKKEELSLAIGLSLSFTVIMMVVLPILIPLFGLSDAVGGAWLGGTIDSTGAVAAAGATLGDEALEVAATVKMIQNILIGVTALCVAVYWVAFVGDDADGTADEADDATMKRPGLSELWVRFPKFVLGFLAASIVFSLVHAGVDGGRELVEATIKGATKTLRGWLFCLAFVSIGLATNFAELRPYLKGGKPLLLYVCGQTLNLVLTLAMAYLMFGVVFADRVAAGAG